MGINGHTYNGYISNKILLEKSYINGDIVKLLSFPPPPLTLC